MILILSTSIVQVPSSRLVEAIVVVCFEAIRLSDTPEKASHVANLVGGGAMHGVDGTAKVVRVSPW